MATPLAAKEQSPTTAQRILDAAEDLFAEKGYSATSLGDVADRVGIRSPSLYNHFRNKEALYQSVLERLLVDFSAPLEELEGGAVTHDRIFQWLFDAGLQPWAVMAFNNLVMSYVTMAPMYRDLLGQDPFSESALENQLNLIKTLLRAVIEYRGE